MATPLLALGWRRGANGRYFSQQLGCRQGEKVAVWDVCVGKQDVCVRKQCICGEKGTDNYSKDHFIWVILKWSTAGNGTVWENRVSEGRARSSIINKFKKVEACWGWNPGKKHSKYEKVRLTRNYENLRRRYILRTRRKRCDNKVVQVWVLKETRVSRSL